MFSSTTYDESVKNSFLRKSPQTIYHNFLVPKKNMDGNFLFQIFKTQNNNKVTKNIENQKRQQHLVSRLRHRSTFNSFSEQKTIKTRSECSQGKQLQITKKSKLDNYLQRKAKTRRMKTSQDTFIFKKSADLRDPFFGFENPQTFQKIVLTTKKRFYHNRNLKNANSLDKDDYAEKKKQETQNQADCRGQKCKLLQNYLSEIKRNKDDLVKKKTTITRIKKRLTTNKTVYKKTLNEFLPKLNVYKKQNKINDSFGKNDFQNNIISGITSKSFAVLYQNLLISGKSENQKREIASLTKIMTCLTGIFLMDKFQLIWQTKLVKVSRDAVSLGGTTANLKTADEIALKDLFYGMMLPSGNDAAFAIGQFFGRMLFVQEINQNHIESIIRPKTSVELNELNKKENFISSKQAMNYFIREMNKIANYLELKNTSFCNCHGLSDTLNYSTANDIVVLTYHCIQIPKFQQIISTKLYQSKVYNKHSKMSRVEKWSNSNLLLHNKKQQCFGGKTGYTSTAGPCLMTYFKHQNKSVIVVLLSCETKEGRFKQAQELYQKLKLVKYDENFFTKKIIKSENETKSSEVFQFDIIQ